MKKHSILVLLCLLIVCMPLLIGCSKDEPASTAFYVTTPIDVGNELLDAVSVTLPDGITRQAVSSIQHDFIKDEQQVGGIVILDISSEILDSPVERLFDIVELIRQQLMPNVAAEDALMISFGGNQNAYMELVTGPDEMLYFHYLFRGVNHTYDVWFNWELLEQNTDMIYEIVSSVAGEDILPENNQNPF